MVRPLVAMVLPGKVHRNSSLKKKKIKKKPAKSLKKRKQKKGTRK